MIINKNRWIQIIFISRLRRVHVSSIVDEGIRVISNLFIYLFNFLQEDFTYAKSTKRIQANKNKKDTIFMRIKTFKRKKITCLAFCAFCAFYALYAHKKHLRRGKSLVCILRFFVFLSFCTFCACEIF